VPDASESDQSTDGLLIKEISPTPHMGTGKPEPLEHAPAGYWSRRIDGEHRIVYKAESNQILIAQLRYHY
jgi:toxin YoeB